MQIQTQKPSPIFRAHADQDHPLNPCSALCAIYSNDDNQKSLAAIFRAFLKHGLDVKLTDSRGVPPLIWSLLLTDDDLVREIIARGANMHVASISPQSGGNAINYVVGMANRVHEEQSLPRLLLFLDKGVNPNVYDGGGFSPLHVAALFGLEQITSVLLAHGANPQAKTKGLTVPDKRNPGFPAGISVIQMAARTGNTEIRRMVAKAAPHLSSIDAATAGAADALRHTLDSEMISPNAVNEQGTPLLTLAARSGDVATVNLLIERGAYVNALSKQGMSALYEASYLGQVDTVRALLAHHADPDILYFSPKSPTLSPTTALTQAIAFPSPEIATLLLQHGATVQGIGKRDALLQTVEYASRTDLALLL